MKWLAKAPSNIALIKYMGRKNDQTKIPDNASLSYTLSDLNSFVELEVSGEKHSRWEPIQQNTPIFLGDAPCGGPSFQLKQIDEKTTTGAHKGTPLQTSKYPENSAVQIYDPQNPFVLSSDGQKRFLAHLQLIQDYFKFSGTFVVRSCNNFPPATGLASSASSFAALTQCAIQAICALTHQPEPELSVIANLSRQGSGSSCRSFYAPWALWDNESVEAIDLPYKDLVHQVILISDKEKEISSSQAHKLVQTSPLYHSDNNRMSRPERAESRLKQLLVALKNQQWADAYQITWDEFQDMHALFETSTPAFCYKTDASKALLTQLQNFWDKNGDGPLITMDAGPNIHLLYRPDQIETIQKIQRDYLHPHTIL